MIELVDELTGDAKKLAVDCLDFHISKLVLEKSGE